MKLQNNSEKKLILKNRSMMLLYGMVEKSRNDGCQFKVASAIGIVSTLHF